MPREGHRPASAARRLALKALRAIDAEGAYANLALDRFLEGSHLSAADRSLATELVYGVTRWRERLDYVLDVLSTRPVGDLPVWIRNILRMGLYQLMYLDRVPARAAVAESVALAKEFGHQGTAALVNAVMRKAATAPGDVGLPPAGPDPAARLTVEYSHPRWLVERWLGRLGPERTCALLATNNEPAPLTLRTNVTRVSREELIASLRAEGATAEPGRLWPESVIARGVKPLRTLQSFSAGYFSVQDEGSMAAARSLGPQPGWLVVDACAGVGGKATHLAELMRDRGRVVAIDPFRHKLALLEQSARRLGLTCIETRSLDARDLPQSDLVGQADAVLVDAPCSGLGVLRRRPDLRWRLRESDIADLASLQGELLRKASECVKPGGVLVYSTCTLEPEENGAVVEGFMDSRREFCLDDAARASGFDRTAGPADSESGPGPAPLRSGPHGAFLFFAPESGGPDGFFVARLARTGCP